MCFAKRKRENFKQLNIIKGNHDKKRTHQVNNPLKPKAIEKFAYYYMPDGSFDQPTVSPLFGDFSKLPPLLFQVGECEILLDDSRRAAEKAKKAGVNAEITIWPGMIHVFQYFAPFLKEARKAIDEIGMFVKRNIP